MTPFAQLLLTSVISLALSQAVLAVLARPLVNILGRICPDEPSAVFWQSYTRVMLVIAPLLLAMVVDFFARYADPADCLRMALIASLAGLLLGLQMVGSRLMRYTSVPRQPGSPL